MWILKLTIIALCTALVYARNLPWIAQDLATINASVSTKYTSNITFLVIPRKNVTRDDKIRFEATFVEEYGREAIVETINDIETGPLLWRVALEEILVNIMTVHGIIEQVVPDPVVEMGDDDKDDYVSEEPGDMVGDKKPEWTPMFDKMIQLNAPPDLAVLSAYNLSAPQTFDAANYQYHSSAGAGITVYIVDSGAKFDHQIFRDMPGQKRFLHPEGGTGGDDDEQAGSGTCTAALVASPYLGVAKNADIVMVKDRRKVLGPRRRDYTFAVSTLQVIKNDIIERNLRGKAVINYSWGYKFDHDEDQRLLRDLIDDILALDVPIVAAAGNSDRSRVSRYPGYIARDRDGIIVVGGSDNEGNLAGFSQGGMYDPVVSVWAPGVGITCPAGLSNKWKKYEGTQFAAPRIAGLAAYLMGLPENGLVPGQVASGVKKLIEDLSWVRKPESRRLKNGTFESGPKVASNHAQPGSFYPRPFHLNFKPEYLWQCDINGTLSDEDLQRLCT